MKISVIIPTLNEAETLPAVLDALEGQAALAEVIVCDGGSSDKTCGLAQEAGARVIKAPCGRGQQLCAGVGKATGDVFWFLHADTIPAPGSTRAIQNALQRAPDAPGGNFRVVFDGESGFAEWLTGFYAWLRSFGVYYGDSAIFVRRSVYDALGGLRDTELMEDYEFTRRLERAGKTLNIDEPSVLTSSRRFQNRAPWRIVLQWIMIHLLYYLHVPGRWLSRLYRSETHVPAGQK